MHPSLAQKTPERSFQARLRKSGIPISPERLAGWALPCRGAAEAQGAIRRVASRRRTILRRGEAWRMAAPWRALRRGHHDRAGGSPEKVDLRNIPYVS